jgi:hypothetical protein
MSLFTIRGVLVSSGRAVIQPHCVKYDWLEFALEGGNRQTVTDVFAGLLVAKLVQPSVIGDFYFDRDSRLLLYAIKSADGQSAYDRGRNVAGPLLQEIATDLLVSGDEAESRGRRPPRKNAWVRSSAPAVRDLIYQALTKNQFCRLLTDHSAFKYEMPI